MKKIKMACWTILLSAVLMACASNYKKVEQDLEKPINCATAEADIRVLESEKVHAAQQLAAGATAIVPIGLVTGVVTGTEGTKARVATGEYNKMLDRKIAEIKAKCGVE